MGEFHGVILNLSQKDRSIFRQMDVIGRRTVLPGILVLYKIQVAPERVDALIDRVQANMAERVLFVRKEFYAHFYRGGDLIVVFRQRVFHVTTDPATWSEPTAYGRSIGIAARQLDFFPCRFEDEAY